MHRRDKLAADRIVLGLVRCSLVDMVERPVSFYFSMSHFRIYYRFIWKDF